MRGRVSILTAALAANGLFLAAAVLLWSTSAWRHYQVVATLGDTSAELLLRDYELTATVRSGPQRRGGSFAQVIDPATLPSSIYGHLSWDFPHGWWIVRWHRSDAGGNLFIPPTHIRAVRFPFWLAVAPLLVWPLAELVGMNRRRRRRRRVAARRCLMCGYDLRATPDRCPECGAVVEPPRRDENPLPLRERAG